jgi:hypothetical protein
VRFYLAAAAQRPARTGFCSMLSFILHTFDFHIMALRQENRVVVYFRRIEKYRLS